MAKEKQKIKLRKGNKVSFTGIRIIHGNPVEGKVLSTDKEGFSLLLSKDIEGINTVWGEGEDRYFRYDMIENLKTFKENGETKKKDK